MASPHIAGLAALFYGDKVHPNWSPATVKSALMTTARNTVTATGTPNTDPFAQGAGEVRPTAMFNPGLVYQAGVGGWLAYLEGLGVDTGTGVRAKDPSDLNSPSIAIGQLLGSQTVTRQVTAVKSGLYRATASVPGVRVRVSPSVLIMNAGETKSFKVSFTRTSAPLGTAATGFLTWRGANTTVRSPIAVTPTAVAAPDTVTGSGASGQLSYSVTPGVSGAFPIKGHGLNAATVNSGSATAGQQIQLPTTVSSGAKVAQFALRSTAAGADLDLGVFRVVDGAAVLVGSGTTPAASETVTLREPLPGSYIILIVAASNAPGTSTTPYSFSSATVTSAQGVGSFAVTPANPTAKVGQPIGVTAKWSGLEATTPYLGYVEYVDGSGTVVRVN
jgi:hypothetical protein